MGTLPLGIWDNGPIPRRSCPHLPEKQCDPIKLAGTLPVVRWEEAPQYHPPFFWCHTHNMAQKQGGQRTVVRISKKKPPISKSRMLKEASSVGMRHPIRLTSKDTAKSLADLEVSTHRCSWQAYSREGQKSRFLLGLFDIRFQPHKQTTTTSPCHSHWQQL